VRNLVPLMIRLAEELIHIKSDMIQSPYADVVEKFRE
ncbi:hypothetical protein TNCV_150961, partial [Trichonephila clavipes]